MKEILINNFKLKLLRSLWLWWINSSDGRELRGTGKLEEIEKYLWKQDS